MQAGETIKHIDDIGPKVANIATQREREREREKGAGVVRVAGGERNRAGN
jgi:hypothetical protein